MKESDFPAPPVADVMPKTFLEFNNTRVDNYFWLRDKENPKVIEYLKAENSYSDAVMKKTKKLQDKIYNEIIGRIKDVDESYPQFENGYYYYSRTEAGKQYRVYCRKLETLDAAEEVMFDVNKMAEGKKAMIFAGFEISPDNKTAAYIYNETGSYAEFILKIRDLTTGTDMDISIPGVSSVAWANDSKTLFYTSIDNTLRPYRVYKHILGSKAADELVYEEKDQKFNIGVSKSKPKDYIFISSSSSTTSEYLYTSADRPSEPFKVFMPRVQGVDYSVIQHKEKFFIRYKDKDNLNGMVYEAPLVGFRNKATWKEFIAHDSLVRIESIDILKDYMALELRKDGLNHISVIPLKGGETQDINFPEPVYSATLTGNPEYNATTIRYVYTSLKRPNTIYAYDILKKVSIVLKEQEIPSGFNPDDYEVERLWAKAPDSANVPMAIVYKKGLKMDGKNPTLITSYGSYGSSSDVYFSPSAYSLINRGFIYAVAQVRGGSDMGEQWYEDGKLMKKKNTFTDFIACAEKLIADKYTEPSRLAATGGSAGGLLMGAVTNMRPDLFQTIVAQVPFVDVINTMMDSSLPLTTQEYEEWGNPNEPEAYNYMLSYSPYDNVKAQNYPNILATGGINDSQVLFHEPAKWVAKLRKYKTDDNLVLLYMNMESGHGGATGRYDSIRDTAFEWAFILNRVGISK
ncbi:MAG: oligopeptidase B [Bacteroidetes bacterium GWF2_40_14]|nr:MAG: oligopeptidase B [Bacteroidetes bacterium GWF2_40_14]